MRLPHVGVQRACWGRGTVVQATPAPAPCPRRPCPLAPLRAVLCPCSPPAPCASRWARMMTTRTRAWRAPLSPPPSRVRRGRRRLRMRCSGAGAWHLLAAGGGRRPPTHASMRPTPCRHHLGGQGQGGAGGAGGRHAGAPPLPAAALCSPAPPPAARPLAAMPPLQPANHLRSLSVPPPASPLLTTTPSFTRSCWRQ